MLVHSLLENSIQCCTYCCALSRNCHNTKAQANDLSISSGGKVPVYQHFTQITEEVLRYRTEYIAFNNCMEIP